MRIPARLLPAWLLSWPIAMASAADPVNSPPVLDAISPYEPVYFLIQPNPLESKFQVSLAVRLVGPPMAKPVNGSRRDGLYVSYSQTSLWDLEGVSKPFFDNSYRPEGWYHLTLPSGPFTDASLEGGVGHESNGRDGPLSRSFNHVFIRPVGHLELGDGWRLGLHPRFRVYGPDLSENPDLRYYRGYVDAEAEIVRPDGIQLAFIGRLGTGMDRSSVQFDVTYPLPALTAGWANAYLHVQVFHGWGETLRSYDKQTSRGLVGISFVR